MIIFLPVHENGRAFVAGLGKLSSNVSPVLYCQGNMVSDNCERPVKVLRMVMFLKLYILSSDCHD